MIEREREQIAIVEASEPGFHSYRVYFFSAYTDGKIVLRSKAIHDDSHIELYITYGNIIDGG